MCRDKLFARPAARPGGDKDKMNYVVVDFEWNQRMFARNPADNRIPFEIIEIGAVKLDNDRNKIGRASCRERV